MKYIEYENYKNIDIDLLPESCFELDSDDFLLSPPFSFPGLLSRNIFKTIVTKTRKIWFVFKGLYRYQVNFCDDILSLNVNM